MRLALYVHDFRLEVGHSNSLIELVRNLPLAILARIDEIEIVSCRATPLDKLFPDYNGKLKWTKIPLEKVKPSLLKSILFQVLVFLYNRLFQKKNTYRIGIGVCSLDVNAISIQFIHHQWTKKGLEIESGYPLRSLYKKVLFFYFEQCEKVLFSNVGLTLFSPAKFLTNHLLTKYAAVDARTIYSGVNLERFQLINLSKMDLKNHLVLKYPILKDIDIEAPIFLFVGAYERKGLNRALVLLKNIPNAQFIVIGSPSFGREVKWPTDVKVFPITFSEEISDFYSLSDAFIFPTIYEPFGLVLFEAMAMGLAIITNKNEVGASELLCDLPEVYFADEAGFFFPTICVKSFDNKLKLREERMKKLGDVSWTKAGNELAEILFAKS